MKKYIMKKLFSTILVLGLLLSGNAYPENITILCVDEKRSKEENRDVHLILNFDEGGNWIKINNRKEIAGRKDNGIGEELTIIEINRDEIKYKNFMQSIKTHMVITVNRFDGSMYQYGKINGEEYYFNYMCEKTDRKF